MIFTETEIKGAFVIEPERIIDKRGYFARTWCKQEFEEHGLNPNLVQCNISFNNKRGTLRGMHYQAKPYEEAKLVRCTRGSIWDVIVDLRIDSNTYLKWFAAELTANNYKMLYVPKSFAHGFQTLEDNSEVFYQMSDHYVPKYSRGIRWDDPLFAIQWPEKELVISEKDQEYPDFLL